MARLETREEFRCYVLRKMGAPLLDLALETDLVSECSITTATTGASGDNGSLETISTSTTGSSGVGDGCAELAKSVCTQLDLAIDDALDYFHLHAGDIGNTKAILVLHLTDGQMVYDVPKCLVAIEQDIMKGSSYHFDDEEAQEGVGLFSLQSQFGPRGVFSYNGAGGQDTLLTYDIASQYNEMVKLRYTHRFQTHHNKLQNQVLITPTPSRKDDGKKLVYMCNVSVPDEHLFGHLFVQRYAVALTMEQVGRNLSMYSGMQLPGGGEFNANFYWDMGREDRDKLEEELATGKWGSPPAGGIMLTG